MAQSSLNQIVLDAVSQANGSTQTASNPQATAQSLLPQSTADFSSALSQAADQIAGLTASNQSLVDVINSNTQAVTQNSSAHASSGSSGGSTASTVGSIAGAVLGSGLGIIPLISSIAGLFGGGSSDSAPTLTKYAAPPSVNVDLADTPGANNGISSFPGVVYGQNGLPQAAPQSQNSTASSSSPSSQQVTVQVNAMDSQSFMDHSYEIAQAVRSAMLNMSSINDVVSDL
jgi:hypothetical protein